MTADLPSVAANYLVMPQTTSCVLCRTIAERSCNLHPQFDTYRQFCNVDDAILSPMSKQSTFMTLYAPLQPKLERFVLAMTRSPETAKDIVSETVLIAYERFDSIRSHEAFLSFLFTVATRAYRKQLRRAKRLDVGTEDLELLLDPGTPPDVAADISTVYEALDRLPAKTREAIILFEILGLSMKEIREIQGGTLVGVKVRISRGRKKLAEILGVGEASIPASARNHQTPEEVPVRVDKTHLYSVGIRL